MPASKAQQKLRNQWIAKNLERINLTVPKGKKAPIQAHAAAQGESVNGFINRAIDETMERDGLERSTETVEGTGGVPTPRQEKSRTAGPQRAAERS